jgi:ketosteroid isomerase-like protein
VASEHEQLIRDWADAFNRGDSDAALGFVHPEVELFDPERTGRSWRGHDEYLEFTREWLDTFDTYRLDVEETAEGPDGTFVRATQSGRGAGSGLEFELPIHFAIRFRDGKVSYYRVATDPETVRREVGLD